ncbi:MAG: excinuclease subunit [Verrucomicrobiales bacterium]|nr:excinuclease subunit [Verrucomicrobiales bacterium]
MGAFDDIREVFAQSPAALQKALNASSFSFNSPQGQCEKCKGAGFEKIEMQFLSDIFVKCAECEGKRYRPHILEARIPIAPAPGKSVNASLPESINISEMLESTVDEAADILCAFTSKQAKRAARKIEILKEVGLGYLRLGQPINTLSGGECQRLKLASYLAEHVDEVEKAKKPALFLFDEPTTGLHFEDVRILLQVFRKLVHLGHSVLVIEHNMDVIRSSDWVIDLGPDAGENGGKIVGTGSPARIASIKESHTGKILRQYF